MITLVSGLFPCLDRSRVESEWFDFVHTLRETGLQLVIYADPVLMDKVGLLNQDVAGQLTIRNVDENAIQNGLWLHSALERLVIDNGHSEPDQLLGIMVRLRAMGWLHDESIFNPYGSDTFVWVDPLLFKEVHPSYIAELGALNLLESLMDPMLVLATSDHGNGSGFSDAIFGGSAPALSRVNNAYWQAYENSINNGEIPSFDSIMTVLWKNLPGLLQRYNLQSNGLASAFFSALVAGPVQLESLQLCGRP